MSGWMRRISLASVLSLTAITFPGLASAAGYGTFADCVRNSGAVMYSASWCPVCRTQRKDFQGYATRLKYVNCSIPGSRKTSSKCKALGIDSFPTWIFGDGTMQSGRQSMSALASHTGCAAPD